MQAKEQAKIFDASYFDFLKYVHRKRWISYYHQIEEVLLLARKTKSKKCLIIGPGGDKIVENALKNCNLDVMTFDISEFLTPNYVGNVSEILQIVGSTKFDIILCCQVLEHIAFNDFEKVLMQFSKISEKGVILSLPWTHRMLLNFNLQIWKLPKIKKIIIVSKNIKDFRAPVEVRLHQWEVGMRAHPPKQIRNTIGKYFCISKEYFDDENPYHRFYVLVPKSKKL